MECAQINVVNGGSTVPSKTYSIPGIYKANDPGILVNIYSMTASSKYIIPGPPVFTCSGGGSAAAAPVASTPTTLLTVAAPEATVAVVTVPEPVEETPAEAEVPSW